MGTCEKYTDHGRCTRNGTHDRGDGRLYCWQHIRQAIARFNRKAV